MVAREWHAVASLSGAGLYTEYVRTRLIPALQSRPGFAGLYLFRVTREGDTSELTVITLWDSLAAVREFAGDDPTQAVVEPEARVVLQSFDDRVRLHEVPAFFAKHADPRSAVADEND